MEEKRVVAVVGAHMDDAELALPARFSGQRRMDLRQWFW